MRIIYFCASPLSSHGYSNTFRWKKKNARACNTDKHIKKGAHFGSSVLSICFVGIFFSLILFSSINTIIGYLIFLFWCHPNVYSHAHREKNLLTIGKCNTLALFFFIHRTTAILATLRCRRFCLQSYSN